MCVCGGGGFFFPCRLQAGQGLAGWLLWPCTLSPEPPQDLRGPSEYSPSGSHSGKGRLLALCGPRVAETLAVPWGGGRELLLDQLKAQASGWQGRPPARVSYNQEQICGHYLIAFLARHESWVPPSMCNPRHPEFSLLRVLVVREQLHTEH